MKNKKCPVDELMSFLEKRSVSDIELEPTPALKSHIDVCEDCKELVNNNRLGEMFLKANRFAEGINSVLKSSVSNSDLQASNVKVGQVCRFKYGENNKKFALIFSNVFEPREAQGEVVRIIPIFPNPNYFDYSEESDFVISETENPLGLPILLEWWNERPIFLSQIDTIYGELSEKQLDKVIWYASGNFDEDKLTKNQKLFRTHEIEIGKLYSENIFDEIIMNEAVVTIDFTPMASSNESLAMAAASPEDNVIKLYDSFVDGIFEQEPDINIELIDNETFCLTGVDENEIKVVMTTKEGKELVLNTDKDNKIIVNTGNCPDISKIVKVEMFCL